MCLLNKDFFIFLFFKFKLLSWKTFDGSGSTLSLQMAAPKFKSFTNLEHLYSKSVTQHSYFEKKPNK
jgi:hypothetical protein